jgi:hypothetical protein
MAPFLVSPPFPCCHCYRMSLLPSWTSFLVSPPFLCRLCYHTVANHCTLTTLRGTSYDANSYSLS